MRGQIFFEDLQAGDGIEGILAFLDNNILTAIETAEKFRETKFAATVYEILENHSESLFNQNFRKKYKKHRGSRPEVFCKVDVLKSFVRCSGKHLCQSLFFNKVAG